MEPAPAHNFEGHTGAPNRSLQALRLALPLLLSSCTLPHAPTISLSGIAEGAALSPEQLVGARVSATGSLQLLEQRERQLLPLLPPHARVFTYELQTDGAPEGHYFVRSEQYLQDGAASVTGVLCAQAIAPGALASTPGVGNVWVIEDALLAPANLK